MSLYTNKTYKDNIHTNCLDKLLDGVYAFLWYLKVQHTMIAVRPIDITGSRIEGLVKERHNFDSTKKYYKIVFNKYRTSALYIEIVKNDVGYRRTRQLLFRKFINREFKLMAKGEQK